MELTWIDDLVALDDAGSLSGAADLRHVTQPAFSRRIKSIEQWLGAPVLDRRQRPAKLLPSIKSQISELRRLTAEFQQVRNDLVFRASNQSRLVVAAQHSLSVSLLPDIARQFSKLAPQASLRIRSANREASVAMLLTGQASILFCYETKAQPLEIESEKVEMIDLGSETLIPVSASRPQQIERGGFKKSEPATVIGYPAEVFFGRLFHQSIRSALPDQMSIDVRYESALVPGVLEMAASGLGIAWAPAGAAQPGISAGRLRDLGAFLPTLEMQIQAVRLRNVSSSVSDTFWEALKR